MRMEELSENRYIKTPDTVEKYLLGLVQTYFGSTNNAPEESREYIIQEAVKRMSQELTLDSMGVTSIIINGEKRIGPVTLTLEDLSGEPAINPKYDAFNVDFGNEKGTACEGNDPRLEDAREPLTHKHVLSDIIGLEGIISSVNGKIERIDGLVHSHNNKPVLDMLVYSGSKNKIDLTVLDNLKDNISSAASQIREDIINYKNDINSKIIDAEDKIKNIDTLINDIRQYISTTNTEYYDESVTYANKKYDALKEEFSFDGYITKDDLNNIAGYINKSISLIDTFSFKLTDVINPSTNEKSFSGTYTYPENITQGINNRSLTPEEYTTDFLIYFIDDSGKPVYTSVPYILFKDGEFKGSLNIGYDNNFICVNYSCSDGIIPDNIQDATIIYRIYSKQGAIE